MLNLTLPYPPSVNDYYGRSQAGVYVKAHGKAYRRRVKEAVLRLDPRTLAAYKLGPLALRVILNPPTGKTAQDVDNGNKALLDALTHAGVWTDDRQVRVLLNAAGEAVECGSVTVSVARLDDVTVYFEEIRRHVA